jgi:hypothetical protein
VVVGVINGIKQFTGLWQEGSDFSIIPTGQDALSVLREVEAIALKSRYFDSEQFLSCLCVPDPNIIKTASCEQFRVACWELNVVNSFVVAGVSQFGSNVVSVAPINGCFRGTAEEVGAVSGERKGGD